MFQIIERQWHCITFLTEANGEGTFILEINDSLLENIGPSKTNTDLMSVKNKIENS